MNALFSAALEDLRREGRAVVALSRRALAKVKVPSRRVLRPFFARRVLVPSLIVFAFVIAAAISFPLAAGGDALRTAASQASRDAETLRAAPPDLRVPPFVIAAATAYEDRAFSSRPRWVPPLSPLGLVRALVRNLRGIPEGGSTIPQQLAKLYLRGARRGSIADKAREALFATWLSRNLDKPELASLYLNLSASTAMGARRPQDGLDRLSLALFGLPLRRLSREDQLVLAGAPRGITWLRAHPQLSSARLAAARAWLSQAGVWQGASYLDGQDAPPDFRFVEGWTEDVASGGLRSADLDLVSAIDRFRDGLGDALRTSFPGASARAAFAAVGAGGAVLARSGAEAALMQVNYGSIAKLELLDFAAQAFGPEAVRELPLPAGPCVRWIWATKAERKQHAANYCPNDVQPADHAMALDESVARSINSMTTRHAALLPVLLEVRRPELFDEMLRTVSAPELAALDSPADRALTTAEYALAGMTVAPDAVPARLSYTAASVALFRTLKARRELAGLPARSLPDDPTQLLGNDSRATVEQIGGYLHKKLFLGDGSCTLSDAGALLALRRGEGTLRWLAQRWRKIVFTGKTGSSPHDDSAVAAVALCLDARPVVFVGALRPIEGALPQGLRGSVVLRGIDAYLRELQRLERKPDSAQLPAWALAEPLPGEPALAAQDGARDAAATRDAARTRDTARDTVFGAVLEPAADTADDTVSGTANGTANAAASGVRETPRATADDGAQAAERVTAGELR